MMFRFLNSDPIPQDLIKALVASEPYLFKKLYRKKILITGGTGFFGRWLLSVLKAAVEYYSLETEVFLLVRKKPEDYDLFECKNIRFYSLFFIESDLLNLDKINIDFDFDFDFVLHMAGSTQRLDYLEKENSEAYKTLVLGTEKLINYLNYLNKLNKLNKLKKILMTSSGAVYGAKNRTDQPISENLSPDLLGSKDSYAEGKLRAEEKFLDSKFPFVIARCFAFYGETQPIGQGFAVADMNAVLEKQGNIKIQNKKTIRSFLYMADLIRGLLFLLLEPDCLGVYNLGGPPNLAESIEKTAIYLSGANMKISDESANTSLLNYYVPSVIKIMSAGFEFKYLIGK